MLLFLAALISASTPAFAAVLRRLPLVPWTASSNIEVAGIVCSRCLAPELLVSSIAVCAQRRPHGASSCVALKFKRSVEDTALRAECQILHQHSYESILQVVDWLDADSMQFERWAKCFDA